jgi:hypothetical protein
LFENLRTSYFAELKKELVNGYRNGINVQTSHSLTAYASAVISWEAFLYEQLYIFKEQKEYKSNIIWDIIENTDKWSIIDKTFLFPKIIFGMTFDKSAQPFQDFRQLIIIRNAIAHYKIFKEPSKIIDNLLERKIAITHSTISFSWSQKLSSSECFRWAINTIAKMVNQFIIFPQFEYNTPTKFNEITEDEINNIFNEAKVDYNTDHDPYAKYTKTNLKR